MENEGQQQPPAQQPPAPVQQQQPPAQPPAQRPPVQVNTGPDLTDLVTKLQALPEQLVNSVREAFPPAAPPAQSSTSSGQQSGQQSAAPVSQVPPAASAGTPPAPKSFGDRARSWWFGR